MFFIDDEPLTITVKDGLYQTFIGKLKFQAETESALLEIISTRYQLVNHDVIDTRHKNYVFRPDKFRPEIKYQ